MVRLGRKLWAGFRHVQYMPPSPNSIGKSVSDVIRGLVHPEFARLYKTAAGSFSDVKPGEFRTSGTGAVNKWEHHQSSPKAIGACWKEAD